MDEVMLHSILGNVILCGDFNSRIGQKQENHNININCHSKDEINDIISNKKHMFFTRTSEDVDSNVQGKLFMEMLNASSMYVLNGRTPGDLSGKYTCHKYNGSSTVDYFVMQTNLFPNVLSMKILDIPWFTDHCPLSLMFKLNPTNSKKIHKNNENKDEISNVHPFKKIRWDVDSDEKYMAKLESDKYTRLIQEFCSKSYNSIDDATEDLTNILTNAGDESLHLKKGTSNNNSQHVRLQKFDNNLQLAKREFKKKRRNFIKDPHNMDKRLSLWSQNLNTSAKLKQREISSKKTN